MTASCATDASKSPRPEPDTALRAAVRSGLDALRAATGLERPRIRVGYSGGLDSSVLLALMAAPGVRRDCDLQAVHVHHGLSPNADAWAAHCERCCAALEVPLVVRRVAVRRAGGQSLEEQAREARHAALRDGACDAIALAHHADDQVETVLLQMLRGAGPRGLAAMAGLQPPARGMLQPWIWRPLLGATRHELARFARVEGLTWIEDESNAQWQARRNVLRHAVVPGLVEHFPAVHANVARVARLQAEAARLLDDLAAIDLARVDAGAEGLDCERLKALPESRVANLLRHWIASAGVRAPSSARLGALVTAVRRSTNDTRLEWRHEGLKVIRRLARLSIVRTRDEAAGRDDPEADPAPDLV